MAQHFLLSKSAKTLSLAKVFQMKDEEAEMAFRRVRWADTDGQPVCPHCGGLDAYDCRRLKGAPRFRCRACVKDFTITSGTLFANHKLPLRCYLAAIAIFCNEVKGKSALALSRDLNVSYKCAFVLLHKLREAMAEELRGRVIGGNGKVAEVDGGYFGGYLKPANLKDHRRDRRLLRNQNGKRKAVVIIRKLKTGAVAKLDAHKWPRDPNDWYVEGHECARALFAVEEFKRPVLDPSCGERKGQPKIRREHEWICGEHWRLVDPNVKRVKRWAERRYRKKPTAKALRRVLFWWTQCKRQAIEVAVGISNTANDPISGRARRMVAWRCPRGRKQARGLAAINAESRFS